MNNQLVIVGMIFILLIVGLSGCTDNSTSNTNGDENKNVENKFIGSWKLEQNTTHMITWTFYNNSSLRSVMTGLGPDVTTWYNYELDDVEMCFTEINEKTEDSSLVCYDYELSNNDTRLKISYEDNTTVLFKIV